MKTKAKPKIELIRMDGYYVSTYSAACSMGRPYIKNDHELIKIGKECVYFGKFDSILTRIVGEYCGFSEYMTQERIDRAKPPIYIGEHKGTFYYFNA